jgi:hypothetical protein
MFVWAANSGEFKMTAQVTRKLYAVRKRAGRWAVWSDDDTSLSFDSYHEAVETARVAATVLADKAQEGSDAPPAAS